MEESVKRFERSNGLDTALNKTFFFFFFLCANCKFTQIFFCHASLVLRKGPVSFLGGQ